MKTTNTDFKSEISKDNKYHIQEAKLSDDNIKRIREEKRIAYVFTVLILLLTFFVNLYFILIHTNLNFLYLIDIGIVMICIIMVFLMNRKYNLDIKQKKVYIITSKVNSKYEEISHEPGSGAMYIPILGHLFPKLWDQKMKAIQVYYLNINNFRYEVNEELYNSVEEGDFVKMYYGKNSNYLLEIKKK